MTQVPSGYTFPILDSSGNPTSTKVDMGDMFVRKDLFLNSLQVSFDTNGNC